MTQGSITWTNTNRRSFPTDEDPLRSRGGAGFQARPQHAAFRAPTGETCRRCMGSYYRRQLFAPLLALQAPQGAYRRPVKVKPRRGGQRGFESLAGIWAGGIVTLPIEAISEHDG